MKRLASNRHLSPKQAGSTLIELLIATVVVGLVLTAVAMSMMYSLQREAHNRYREYALQLAQEAIEQLNFERAKQGWAGFAKQFADGRSQDWCFFYEWTGSRPAIMTPRLVAGRCQASQVVAQYGVDFFADLTIAQSGGASKLEATVVVRGNAGSPNEFTYELTQHYYEREY